MRTYRGTALALSAIGGLLAVVGEAAAQDKPNILVIWGDDIGQGNISAYTKGVMGYRTPNIDRAYLLVPAQAYVGKFLGTFTEFPPRQKAASFSLDQVMAKLSGGRGD